MDITTIKTVGYALSARAVYFVFTHDTVSYIGLKRFVLGYDNETYFEDIALGCFVLLGAQITMLGMIMENQKVKTVAAPVFTKEYATMTNVGENN